MVPNLGTIWPGRVESFWWCGVYELAARRKNALGIKAAWPGFIEPALASSIVKVPDGANAPKPRAPEGAHHIGHAALHIHGGISIDVDYPIHRYFLWGKQIELLLGGPSAQLAKLGADLAEQARTGAEAAT